MWIFSKFFQRIEISKKYTILTRMLQFRGNMSAIIRYSKAFLRLFQVMQKVPVEY